MSCNKFMDLDATMRKLTKEQLIGLMYNALDEMQVHNSRSRVFCIAKAMGLNPTENDACDGYDLIPITLKEIKNNCDYF